MCPSDIHQWMRRPRSRCRRPSRRLSQCPRPCSPSLHRIYMVRAHTGMSLTLFAGRIGGIGPLVENFRQAHPECDVPRAQWNLRMKSGDFAVKVRPHRTLHYRGPYWLCIVVCDAFFACARIVHQLTSATGDAAERLRVAVVRQAGDHNVAQHQRGGCALPIHSTHAYLVAHSPCL